MSTLQFLGAPIVLSTEDAEQLARLLVHIYSTGESLDTYEEGSFGLSSIQLGLLNDSLKQLGRFKAWVAFQMNHLNVRSQYMANEESVRQTIADVLVEFGFSIRDACRAALECQFPIGYTQFNFSSLAVVHVRLFSGLSLSTDQCRILTDRITLKCNDLQFVDLPNGVSTCFPAICFHLQALHQVCSRAGMVFLVHPTVMLNETVVRYHELFNPGFLPMQ